MNIHSIFLKIGNLTKPERFLDAGANKERIWASSRTVVREYFEPASEAAPHGFRRASSASLGDPNASRLMLSISTSSSGKWDVSLVDNLRANQYLCDASFEDPSHAIKAYKTLYAAMTKKSPGAGLGRPTRIAITAAASVAFIYVALSLFGAFLNAGGGAQTTQAGYMQPAQYQQGYPAQAAPSQAQSGEDSSLMTSAERKLIAEKGSKIQLSNSGAELVVFSDPQCPFCKRLEPNLEQVGKSGKITMIPVAYKDGSQELVASVLCAKDQVQAWKQVIATGKPAGPVCEAGMKKVEKNNQLFADLRFTATPTIVSPAGAVVASALDVEQLGILLKN